MPTKIPKGESRNKKKTKFSDCLCRAAVNFRRQSKIPIFDVSQKYQKARAETKRDKVFRLYMPSRRQFSTSVCNKIRFYYSLTAAGKPIFKISAPKHTKTENNKTVTENYPPPKKHYTITSLCPYKKLRLYRTIPIQPHKYQYAKTLQIKHPRRGESQEPVLPILQPEYPGRISQQHPLYKGSHNPAEE